MSHRYFDRQGKPMSMFAWAMALERGAESRRVAADDIGDDVAVSTVWLGLNHQWGEGPPLIFETMIFGGPHSEWCQRYATEEEALAGHIEIVRKLRAGEPLEGEGE